MLSQTITIARNTYLESVRQPIYFILTMLAGILIVLATWGANFSMGQTSSAEVSGDDKLLLDLGLATAFVVGVLMAAFLSTAVISREIENKTVLTVVSKPVSRVTVVLGKYVGVTAAIVFAVTAMLIVLQLCLRHKVMSTSADAPDGPVILFGMAALMLAVGAGVWCNFFYGWVFTQTATQLLTPLLAVAWVGVLFISKEWTVQPIGKDLKPQVLVASATVLLSMGVMTAVSTAASARFGQVMTIVICTGVLVFGLMSNYLFGRHAVDNEVFARIKSVQPTQLGHTDFNTPGDEYTIEFLVDARKPIAVGSSFYYGPNPSGLDLSVAPFPPFEGDPTAFGATTDRARPASVVVVQSESKKVVVQRAGAEGPLVRFPPAANDYVFVRPTTTNRLAMSLWGIVPNMQFFWLVDAVTQNNRVPPSHLGLVAGYALLQIGVFLSLAVILFQKREVG